MSRRVYLLGLGLALVTLAFAVTDWALGLRPGVTEANVKRVRVGMTLAEVEGILGEAGDPFDCANHLLFRGQNRNRILVQIDRHGRVRRAVWVPSREEPTSPLARLRAWLGW
jgi:hypothetical protein